MKRVLLVFSFLVLVECTVWAAVLPVLPLTEESEQKFRESPDDDEALPLSAVAIHPVEPFAVFNPSDIFGLTNPFLDAPYPPPK